MAKRSGVTVTEPIEPVEEPTEEQIAEWEHAREQEREERLAPYRAFHQQQTEQDELIAELMFKETMKELEG